MLGFTLPLPPGDAGTLATLQHMRQFARRAALHPLVRQVAARAVLGAGGFDGTLQAKLLNGWLTDRTLYLADPLHAEALHEPTWALQQILTRGVVQLDCDDVAMLAAALGLSIGLRARFVAVGFSHPSAPFRHVWSELADARRLRWVAVDPTRPASNREPAIARTLIQEV